MNTDGSDTVNLSNDDFPMIAFRRGRPTAAY